MTDIEKKTAQPLDTLFTADEYKELLLQAVAVIESARCRLARHAAFNALRCGFLGYLGAHQQSRF